MDRKDYEKHQMGELCWECHAATHGSGKKQRQCPRCRGKWSHEQRRLQWEILKAFVLGATAHHTARTLRISYPTVWGPTAAPGGNASGKRASGNGRRSAARSRPTRATSAAGAKASAAGERREKCVFSACWSGAARSTGWVVPDCTKETLMAKIRGHSVKGSVYYTDEFGGYNDLRSHGKHLPP